MNITDGIWKHSHLRPADIAIVQDGRPVTYSALRASVERVMTRLQARGVKAADSVALSVEQPAAHLCLVLALARIGAVSSPLYAHWSGDVRDAMLRRHRVQWCICDARGNCESPSIGNAQTLGAADLFESLESEVPSEGCLSSDGGSRWRIFLSSGTTGVPKSIPWTHRASVSQASLTMQRDNFGTGTRLLVLSDLHTFAGLIPCIRQLLLGNTLVFQTRFDATSLLSAVAAGEVNVLSCSPVVAAGLFGPVIQQGQQRKPLPLRALVLAGGMVSEGLTRVLQQLFQTRILVRYGSTEIGGIAAKEMRVDTCPPHCAGHIYPWIEAQAVSDAGHPLETGRVGMLRFRSVCMSEPGLDSGEAPAATVSPFWHYPGDLGAVTSDGLLFLHGRQDDRLNVGGVKIDPLSIESALCSNPAIQEAGLSVTDGDGPAPLVVVALVIRTEEDPAALDAMCARTLGTLGVPYRYFVVSNLPMTPAGKLDRAELQKIVNAFAANVEHPLALP